jgi:O-glycosyl hydrolase
MYLGVDTCLQHNIINITVNPDSTYQSIHSFGASDAWACKFYGKWTDNAKKAAIADWLFSTDTMGNGNPRGIGLTLWRFNIGGGSFEQGDASHMTDEWRREECFMDSNGTYNWNKQSGQQWFLQAARQRGVKYTLGFSLTPPVFMTKNGKAFNGTTGVNMNIQDGKMDAYASFLAEVTRHFQFDYLSPVNEPQWSWGQATSASQEGTQATNNEIATFTKLLSQKLSGSSAKIVIGEAGQLDFLYGRNNDGRGDQIAQFFAPASPNYIGNQPNVEHAISAHSYFTTCPDDALISTRKQVADKIKQVDAGLQTWQSEFGILGNICGQYSGSPRNTGIDYGLYVAKVIHHDLTVANVTSWQWWLGVSPYNYSDALIYVNDLSGQINVANTKTDGIISDSKQLWVLGNYARFIRPGMKRIAASVTGAQNSLMVSAYKEAADKKLVVVIINPSTTEQIVKLDQHVSIAGNRVSAYTTNNTLNLRKSVVAVDHITLPPKSIVTLTGSIVNDP